MFGFVFRWTRLQVCVPGTRDKVCAQVDTCSGLCSGDTCLDLCSGRDLPNFSHNP